MNKTLRPLAALALIAMVALISGCGSSTPVQTSTGTGSSTGAGGNKNATDQDKIASPVGGVAVLGGVPYAGSNDAAVTSKRPQRTV